MAFTSAPEPIVPDMDARIRSVVNKYARPSDPTFARELQRASPAAERALRALDAKKLQSGSRALSQPQSAVGLRAASTGESVIGDPDQNIWGDFTRNVGEMVSGLPRLPQALVGEVRDMATLPEQIGGALKEGDSPLEDLGNLANLPGLRMIPGSFVAGQFGTGGAGVQGLVDNPLFTALDVLPYASKAAGATKTFKTAASLAGEGERVGKFGTVARYARPSGPMLDDAGKLVPNALGRTLEAGGERLAQTRVGNAAKVTWGKRAKAMAQENARIGAELTDPKIASAENAELVKLRADMENAARDVDPARRVELTRLADRGELTDDMIRGLPQNEREFVRYQDQSQRLVAEETLRTGENVELEIPLASGKRVKEIYTAPEARKILRSRATRDRFAPLADTAADLAARTPATVDAVAARMARSVGAPMAMTQRGWQIRAEIARLELAGFEVSGLKKRLQGITKADDMRFFQADLAENPPALAHRPLGPPDRAALQALARTDPLVRSFMDSMDAGSWRKATDLAKKIGRRTRDTGGIDWKEAARYTRAENRVAKAFRHAEREKFAQLAARAEKQVAKVEQSTMPARYATVAGEKARAKLGVKLADMQAKGQLSAEDAAQASAMLALEKLDAPSLPESVRKVARDTSREVQRSWQEFAEAGIEPRFVHRTRRNTIGRAPTVSSARPHVSSVVDRQFDFGSTVEDWAVAIDAQAMEILQRRGSEQWQDFVIDSFSKELDDIHRDLAPFAQDIVNRGGAQSPSAVMDSLVARNWEKISTYRGEVYVPRDVAGVYRGFAPKQINSAVMKAYDKTMGLFRTSLLPLSPRWHLYNVVGGAIMLTAEHGPGVWRHWKKAWDIARHGGLEDVRDMPAMGASTRALREQTQWARGVDLSTDSGKALALWDTASGKFLRRIWDESEQAAVAKRGGRALLDRSYAINEMFDDAYRSMAYLHGQSGAVKRGLDVAGQEAAGVAAARRVLANWDRLTPVERSVIRNIFPFYSWSKHLLGYVSRFPFDHPLRTAVTASLVQAELDDFGTGLPQQLFSLIDVTGPASWLGVDTKPGEKVMLNMDGMNPFRDVASWASLVSFMGSAATGKIDPSADIGAVTSQSSPALQFLLGAVGVDPAEGAPDPYGQVTLDPATGMLKSVNEFNPLTAIPQSLVPQSRILMDAVGLNQDFQRLVHSNPDAARRRILTSAGLPAIVSPRTVDVSGETIKAEVRRYEDVSRTRAQALRSGNLDVLDRYPSLLGPTKKKLEEAKRRGALDVDESAIQRAAGV